MSDDPGHPFPTSHTDQPPPYGQAVPGNSVEFLPAMATQTETVVTTRTVTITTFLPIFKKKRPSGGKDNAGDVKRTTPKQRPDTDDPAAFSVSNSGNALRLNKALPATPPVDEPSSSKSGHDLFPPRVPRRSTSHTALALAHASLNLGLTPVMPKSPPSTSSTRPANETVDTEGPNRPSSPTGLGRNLKFAPDVRQTREPSPQSRGLDNEARDRRRKRGLSLGPLDIRLPSNDNSTKSSPTSKGKQKQPLVVEPNDDPSRVSSDKSMPRRMSFWRRRTTSEISRTPSQEAAPIPPTPQLPSNLPTLRPLSPLFADSSITSSPSPDLTSFSSSGDYISSPRDLFSSQRRRSTRSPPMETMFESFPAPVTTTSPVTQYDQWGAPAINGEPPDAARTRTPSLHHSQSSEFQRMSTEPTRPVSSLRRHASTSSSTLSSRSWRLRPRSMSIMNPKEAQHHVSEPVQPIFPSRRASVHLGASFNTSSASSLRPSSYLSTSNSLPFTSDSHTHNFGTHSSRNSTPLSVAPSLPTPDTDHESPEIYVERLMQAVSKSEIAGVLARSGGAFHASALQCYIDRFEFNGDPLDVALRKLLMDVGLPKETQQIDRVMEAFAKRYTNCNPGLFISEDQPYVLAFSLMMLHTDAFNKSNKRKMTKVDYIKNTRLPGLAQEILDCFFDNIVFAPFIFIEDPTDVNGQRGIVPEGGSSSRIIPSISGLSASGNNSSTSIIGKANKIDPYYLITRNLLGSLRVDVDAHISPFDPYLPDGTLGPRNEVELRKAFARADVIEVSEPRRSSVPFLGNGSTGSSVAVNTSATSLHSPVENTSQSNEETWTLKVTKCGLLNRKEDVSEGGKRATARKWREWSVILTGSQLLFFRDPNWATTLLAQAGSPNGQVLFPHTTLLKPDELLSVNDSIALYDVSYTKYSNTLRFVMANGRQFLLQAGSEVEMNDWIHKINYASTFRTVGVRIRSLALSSEDVKMTGVAAAASHMQDRSMPRPPAQTLRSWTSQDHIGQDSPPKQRHPRTADDVERPPTLTRKLSMIRTKVPLEKSDPVDSQDSEQLKATFDQVKATLAENASKLSEPRYRAMSFADSLSSAGLSDSVQSQSHWSDDATVGQHSSRSSVIRTKILELESKITTLRSQLESDVRLSLNLALLTPFQKSTRDRIEATAIALGKKIQLHRLELAKLGCHHSILLEDLQSANSEWQCVKKGALRAANNALENNLNSPIPRMKISVAATESPGLGLSPLSVDTADRADSSVCDSFYSAVETLDAESNLGGSPLAAEEPGTPGSSSFRSVLPHGSSDAPSDHGTSPNLAVPSSNLGRSGSLHIPPPSPSTTPTSLPRTSEEKAEEWNETRAAKRVSLVRLPSQLKLSTALGKSSRTQA